MKIICAIKDNAVEAFGQPIFVNHRNEAIRAFGDEMQNPQSTMHKHPNDYDLYIIGRYNEETGELFDDSKERIARGIDYVQSE